MANDKAKPVLRAPAAVSGGTVLKYSFAPFIDRHSRVLILGTLPGEDSLRLQQYYGHKHNAFWRLIAAVFGEKEVPAEFPARKEMLRRNRIAIWDVLESAERIGSSDAAIRNATPNDFSDLFSEHSGIKTIAFNGQKAEALFRRYVLKPGIVREIDFRMVVLPSSSPLHTMSFETKLRFWRAALARLE